MSSDTGHVKLSGPFALQLKRAHLMGTMCRISQRFVPPVCNEVSGSHFVDKRFG